jgi:hypothetical protein
MKVKYEYTSAYNFRPEECFGMGKETITVSGEGDLNEFLERLQRNSQLKHENDLDWGYCRDVPKQNPEWTPYIGQPMFYIYDLKIEPVEVYRPEDE